MKTFVISIILSLFAALPILAADETDMPDTMQSGMMNPQMMKMHQHMQDMQALMSQIQQEQDSTKFRQMMHRHMAMMQEGYHMMDGSIGMGMQGGMMNRQGMKNMQGIQSESMNSGDCNNNSRGQNMRMMHQMMGQMMQHMQMMEDH